MEGPSTLEEALRLAGDRFGAPLVPNLRYRDSDGDLIVASSTAELRAAICSQRGAGLSVPRFLASASAAVQDDAEWELVGEPTGAREGAWPAGLDHESALKVTVNGRELRLERPSPQRTLADYLREDLLLTGTKVACGEGGCGACTVAAVPPGGGPALSINACLRPLCAMDGWSITTVEGLQGGGGGGCCRSRPELSGAAEHVVPRKLAEGNGVQCGFCSPGWVMGMYALLERGGKLKAEEIEQHFDGNLCRCTGYRPIIQAFHAFAGEEGVREHRSCGAPARPDTDTATVGGAADRPLLRFASSGDYLWYTVFSMDQLREVVLRERPRVPCLVAAHTALGGVRKYYDGQRYDNRRTAAVSVDISQMRELRRPPEVLSSADGDVLQVGAATSIAALIEALVERAGGDQDCTCGVLAAQLRRVASTPVRNVATWAGNLALQRAYPHFVSDLAPALAAAGAWLTLSELDCQSGTCTTRQVGVEEYLGTPAGAKGLQLVASLGIPLPPAAGAAGELSVLRCYKAAQRHANSHSIVSAGLFASVRGGEVQVARLFFGGLCGKGLVRATAAEAALKGAVSSAGLGKALAALGEDVERCGGAAEGPLNSAEYRLALARAHLYRLLLALSQKTRGLPRAFASALTPFATAASRPPLQVAGLRGRRGAEARDRLCAEAHGPRERQRQGRLPLGPRPGPPQHPLRRLRPRRSGGPEAPRPGHQVANNKQIGIIRNS